VREEGAARLPTFFRNLRPPQQLIENRPPKEYTISNRPLAALDAPQPVNIVLLDTRNTDPEFQPWMQSQVLRFVSLLRPDADIALYQFAASGLRILHEFSHDTSALSNAVKEVLEPATARELERESASGSLRFERYRKTCEALSAMAEYLGKFKHRKNLLWIAGDFPPAFDHQECQATAIALNKSNTALYPVDVRSPVIREPFQPVAPGDLRNVPRNRRKALSRKWLNTMSTLAALTGGRALKNRSQLAEAMIDALNETRFAYELGFSIPEAQCDGALHPLKVQVKMRDAVVLAKQAFVADCDQRTDKPPPNPFDSPAIGITVMPSLQNGGAMRLKVLIAAADLQWKQGAASIEATVSEAGSEGRALLSQTFETTGGPVELEVKPSAEAQTLHVAVRDKANQRQGSVTLPVLRISH
jgi:VWFA-related protein